MKSGVQAAFTMVPMGYLEATLSWVNIVTPYSGSTFCRVGPGPLAATATVALSHPPQTAGTAGLCLLAPCVGNTKEVLQGLPFLPL